MNSTYAGIGSRETPDNILDLMIMLGSRFAELGFTLHSGGARDKEGLNISADTAFENGCDLVGGSKKIFLPWKGFNGSNSELYHISPEAKELAHYYYHQPTIRFPKTLKLMARNGYQVLDLDLQTPVDFIVCWTPGGKKVGGTSQAIRIADDRGIPVYNLFSARVALQGINKRLRQLGVEGLKE